MVLFLLSILSYLNAEDRRGRFQKEIEENEYRHTAGAGRWYWLSLLAFVLAMLSKGSAAILPLVLLGLVWWQRGRLTLRDVLRTAPFFLISASLTFVNVWFQTHGSGAIIRDVNFGQRLAGAGAVIWFYLSKALVPIDLMFVYPQWTISISKPLWWLPLVAAAAVTVLLWWRRNSRQAIWVRPLLYAWGFFCVTLVPVLGFTDVGFMEYSLVADHYQHIAIIGVLALVAAAWSVWHDRAHGALRLAATAAAVLLVSTLTLLTWQQSSLYAGPLELYQATLEKNPECWLVHNNLGVALHKSGQSQEAIQQIDQALRLKSNFALAHYNLGVVFYETGRPKIAIAQLELALECDPKLSQAHNDLGLILATSGRLPEAIDHFEQSLWFKPDYVNAQLNLANALALSGRPQEAIKQYDQALRLDPDDVKGHYNLGNALVSVGRQQEAIEHYQLALRLKPDYIQAYTNLARVYAQQHRFDEAVATAQQGLDMARSTGQAALAEQIDAWLTSYLAQQAGMQDTSSPSGGARPAPAP